MNYTEFFQNATGFKPFPYQEELAKADMSHMALAAPTGAGKTAAAILAWLWQRRENPSDAPTRLILCEPQRTLVEQVYLEVQKWLRNLGLEAPVDGQTGLYNKDLNKVSLHAMQGGFIDELWELCPEQPAVIIGTQDQLLSRALNRGYAMSRFRWPIHFGLFHNDCQWVFDEIQLMGPGLTTSAQLHGLREKLGTLEQVGSLWMSATLNKQWLHTVDHPLDDTSTSLTVHKFSSDDEERMADRLEAKKPLFPLPLSLDGGGKKDVDSYIKELANQVTNLHQAGRFTLVIMNTVDRARALHKNLKNLKKHYADDTLHLLHSRFRPYDRSKVLAKATGQETKGKIVISTQVVEAGVDISADLLITELAPIASMIQRFGRCNRKGEQDHAQVHWVDLTDDKAAAPYLIADLDRSRDIFSDMESVSPSQFLKGFAEDWPLYDTLRRKDLLELFDTAADLSGLSIDVGRFIRDGEDRDVFFFWRDWDGQKPSLDVAAAQQRELCRVSIIGAKKIAEKSKLWYLDDLRGKVAEWKVAHTRDITPGKTYMLTCDSGQYTSDGGWTPGSKAKVTDIIRAQLDTPFPKMASDPLSEERKEDLSLQDHTLHVCQELDLLLKSLLGHHSPLPSLLRDAARWHDVGKAHPIFQATMHKGGAPENGTLWAKCTGRASHSQRYFRHELASALAALVHSDLDFLAIYLIASHHGKARLSVRAFPEEEDNFILGIEHQSQLPEIRFVDLDLQIPATELSHKVFEFGRNSWQDRCLALRDDPDIGPFRLAYLEAILRAADVRASIKEKRAPVHV